MLVRLPDLKCFGQIVRILVTEYRPFQFASNQDLISQLPSSKRPHSSPLVTRSSLLVARYSQLITRSSLLVRSPLHLLIILNIVIQAVKSGFAILFLFNKKVFER